MIYEKTGGLIMDAMKKKDRTAEDAYKALKTAFTEFLTQKDRRKELGTQEEMQVIRRLVKERRESARLYAENGRGDLAGKETGEADILEALLPAETDISVINAALAIEYPEGILKKDIGSVMKAYRTRYPGADGKTLFNAINQKLV